jgi:hypothetical protein
LQKCNLFEKQRGQGAAFACRIQSIQKLNTKIEYHLHLDDNYSQYLYAMLHLLNIANMVKITSTPKLNTACCSIYKIEYHMLCFIQNDWEDTKQNQRKERKNDRIKDISNYRRVDVHIAEDRVLLPG